MFIVADPKNCELKRSIEMEQLFGQFCEKSGTTLTSSFGTLLGSLLLALITVLGGVSVSYSFYLQEKKILFLNRLWYLTP